MSSRGIYVEIAVRAPLEEVWRLTQDPTVHQRWDLRFATIDYLPRVAGEPQRFLYITRLGFGLGIAGEGETVGTHESATQRTSALRFGSDSPLSLIREGSGYWKYIEREHDVLFFTWYDYKVRCGWLGTCIDRAVFRRLIGWATAWSFDRLRLWAERGAPPEWTLTANGTTMRSSVFVSRSTWSTSVGDRSSATLGGSRWSTSTPLLRLPLSCQNGLKRASSTNPQVSTSRLRFAILEA